MGNIINESFFFARGKIHVLVYVFTRIILLILRSRGSTQLREKTKTRKEFSRLRELGVCCKLLLGCIHIKDTTKKSQSIAFTWYIFYRFLSKYIVSQNRYLEAGFDFLQFELFLRIRISLKHESRKNIVHFESNLRIKHLIFHILSHNHLPPKKEKRKERYIAGFFTCKQFFKPFCKHSRLEQEKGCRKN